MNIIDLALRVKEVMDDADDLPANAAGAARKEYKLLKKREDLAAGRFLIDGNDVVVIVSPKPAPVPPPPPAP